MSKLPSERLLIQLKSSNSGPKRGTNCFSLEKSLHRTSKNPKGCLQHLTLRKEAKGLLV